MISGERSEVHPMFRSFVMALSLALIASTACLAEDCSKQSSCKKVSLLSKVLHKKACVEAKKTQKDADGQIAGSNFIIN